MTRSSRLHTVVLAGRQVGIGGSVPRVAAEQANHLVEHFDVTVAAKEVEGLRAEVEHWPLTTPELTWLRRFSHAPRELALSRDLRSALRRLHARRPVDFVLCNSHTAAAWAADPLKRGFGVPFGVVTHGDIFHRPPGTYSRSMTWIYKRATVRAYRQADLVVALSPYMADCARSGGARPQAVEVIPNGIAPNHEQPGDGDAGRPTGIAFLSVGRVAPIKNVPLLLRAFGRLDAARGHTLTVVGDGPQLRECVDLARTLELDGVEFVGFLPGDRLPEVYRDHDVFCITSRDDALPTTVLEAMREGLPVVGTDVGGIPYLVRHQTTGLIVPSDDVDAFARAMDTLAGDAPLRRRLGENGRSRVAAEFAWPRVAERLAEAIRDRIAAAAP